MLRRVLYRGHVVWNRSKFLKAPGTNKLRSRPHLESERCLVERPGLRVIDEDLWNRVQKRLARVQELYGGARPGLLDRTASSPYLLSGLLKCGVCGAKLAIVTGRGKNGHPRYGCPQNFYRGACPNNLKERHDWTEERFFAELQDKVLHPEVIEYAMEEFGRQLQSSLADLAGELARMKARRDQISAEVSRLVAAIAQGGYSDALLEL